jgi:hypothetical protein
VEVFGRRDLNPQPYRTDHFSSADHPLGIALFDSHNPV